MLDRRKSEEETFPRATGRPAMAELATEQETERLVSAIDNLIRAPEPDRRVDLKDYTATLLSQETDVAEFQQPFSQRPRQARPPQNPLAAGLLLALLGGDLALVRVPIGITLAFIGIVLIVWGGVMSWRRQETQA